MRSNGRAPRLVVDASHANSGKDHVRQAEVAQEIAAQVADSSEVAEVVTGLEQQYDAFTRGSDESALPLAEERELPTAEELGAEFERFLAGLDDDD